MNELIMTALDKIERKIGDTDTEVEILRSENAELKILLHDLSARLSKAEEDIAKLIENEVRV